MKHLIFACLLLGSEVSLAAQKENESKPPYDPVYGRAIRQSTPPQKPIAASAPETVYSKAIRMQDYSPASKNPGKPRPVSQQSPGISEEIKIGKRGSVNLSPARNHKPAISIPNILNQSDQTATITYLKSGQKKKTTVELSPRTGQPLDLELNEDGINIKTSAGEYQIVGGGTANGNQAVLVKSINHKEEELDPIKNGKYRLLIQENGELNLEPLTN